MAKKAENTSFGTLTLDYMKAFLREHATDKQKKEWLASAKPILYAVPDLDANGQQKVIPAHLSKTGKQMQAKLAVKWTIPADAETEKKYITARYATRNEYSHLHAKNAFADLMGAKLKELDLEYLLPVEGKKKDPAKSTSLEDDLFA